MPAEGERHTGGAMSGRGAARQPQAMLYQQQGGCDMMHTDLVQQTVLTCDPGHFARREMIVPSAAERAGTSQYSSDCSGAVPCWPQGFRFALRNPRI